VYDRDPAHLSDTFILTSLLMNVTYLVSSMLIVTEHIPRACHSSYGSDNSWGCGSEALQLANKHPPLKKHLWTDLWTAVRKSCYLFEEQYTDMEFTLLLCLEHTGLQCNYEHNSKLSEGDLKIDILVLKYGRRQMFEQVCLEAITFMKCNEV
jgi:hypothetical protein